MSATVLTALGPDWEGRMVEIVDRLPGVVVGRRCADLADLLAAASAGRGDVALVSGELRGLDRDALSHLTDHGVRVVGASREGAEDQERQLRQLGIPQHIHLGTPREELVEALTSADVTMAAIAGLALDLDESAAGEGPPSPIDEEAEDEQTPRPRDDAPGTVVAVWGPTGGPGRSTLAVNLASEVAASGTPALLVDLDTYGASVAQLLSVLDEAPGLAAAARASELGTLDLPSLARLAVEVAPGLRVLTGIPTASRWTEVRPAAIEQIIELARSLAAVVVLDCGFNIEDDEELSYDTLAPRRNATTLTALAESDELLLVGAADPIGLQRMVRAVQAVGQVRSPRPRPVVNRVRASSVGPDPRRRVAESLERFAGLDDVIFLPDDPVAADAGLLSGQTLVECAPESELRLAIGQVAALFTGRSPIRRPARRWLRRPRVARLPPMTSHPQGGA
ncbi:AAA family ATPase [Janibacter cremeus]|uniref:Flp pilus assembly CpaE family ATPase n=1 Tax=Janibacter cremeus TaxID=1285192 RepID=A0A852VWV9_9MICO|nr:Flp pilus assembly CpaE family ATPase [Janibacter cremeus]